MPSLARCFLLLAALGLLSACATTDPTFPSPTPASLAQHENEARSAQFPRVTSPGWRRLGNGVPSMLVSGYFGVSYAREGSPGEVAVMIYEGNAPSFPKLNDQEKGEVTIFGQTIRTYPSGNEDPAFATLPIRLKAPNGRTAYYSFEFEGGQQYRTRAIPEIDW